jgi:hypothetical protein
MRKIIYFFISLSLCSCSNIRSKESCENFNSGDYRSNQTEEYDYEYKREICEIQHGIKIDREKFSKERSTEQMKILKANCTCESGFTRQSSHQFPNDPKQREWAEKCMEIAMDKEYLRGIEIAKTPLAKQETESEMRKAQGISHETAQAYCKKN